MKRIAFYTHDSFGLGHARRVVKLANEITRKFSDSHCLIITGMEKIGIMPLSSRVDFARMPGVTKIGVDRYRSRSLKIPLKDIVNIRSSIVQASLESFKPDFFIVDNVPLGMSGEIKGVLEKLKKDRKKTRVILTMRDILDDPAKVEKAWAQMDYYHALEHFYDLILVFGEPEIFNPIQAYAIPSSISSKFRFCGYLGASFLERTSYRAPKGMPQKGQKLITVTAGGGEDGYPLIKAYLTGVDNKKTFAEIQHLILLGPFMPTKLRHEIHSKYGNKPGFFIRDFVPDTEQWIKSSEMVVSMGGYNTIYEVLSLNKRSLVIPRVFPRKEQLIRAEILSELGLLKMIHPERLSPLEISNKVINILSSPKRSYKKTNLNFKGHEMAMTHIKSLLHSEESKK